MRRRPSPSVAKLDSATVATTKPKKKSAAKRKRAAKGDAGSWLRVPNEASLPEDVQSLFERARQKLGIVPNVFRFLALRPEHLRKWRAYYDELMVGESNLTKAQREMIAVVVSSHNHCVY